MDKNVLAPHRQAAVRGVHRPEGALRARAHAASTALHASELPIPPALEALVLECLERGVDAGRATACLRQHLSCPARDERPVAEVLLSREARPDKVLHRAAGPLEPA